MTRPNALRYAFIMLCSMCLYGSDAVAQYLYLDANGDGVRTASDVLAPSGATTIDIWLDTDSNRDGSLAVCSTQDGDLTINSYEFILHATNGTVTWGTFANLQTDFTTSFGQASNATDFYTGFGGGVILPPGLYRLATLEASVGGGTPAIAVASSTTLGNVYLTSFGSRCSGSDFDNTLKLGTDWFDADGLPYGGASNVPPSLAPPQDMEVAAGSVKNQTLTAGDPDGDPLAFSMVSGPTYMSVTTLSPGAGSALGNVRLEPPPSMVGTTTQGTVAVTDGFASDEQTFAIQVTPACSAGFCLEQGRITVGRSINIIHGIDLDGNAALDLLSFEASALGWWAQARLGRGDGTFHLSWSTPIIAGLSRVWDSAVGDLNADGKGDFVVIKGSQLLQEPRTIEVFLGNGDGSFQPSGSHSPTGVGTDLQLRDMNGDGATDIVVASAGGILVLSGLGDGTFQSTTALIPGAVLRDFQIADVSGDGIADIAGLDGSATRIDVFRGRADGTFESATSTSLALPLLGSNANFLVSGDMNADGLADFAAVPGTFGPGRAYFLRGTGTGALTPTQLLSFLGVPWRMDLVDMNGDGARDAVTMTLEFPGDDFNPIVSTALSVSVGNGDGTLGPRTEMSLPHGTDMETGDWNSDGRPDVIIADSPGQALWVFLNRGYTPHENRPPEVKGSPQVTVGEGNTRSFYAFAADPDAEQLDSFEVDRTGLPASIRLDTTVQQLVPGRIEVRVTPDFGTMGDYALLVRASSGGQEGFWPVALHVVRHNRPPIADAGGPYAGIAGVPVVFDASGSQDPDGDPLSYQWSFGDGQIGLGAVVEHAYQAPGTYGIQLTVRDPGAPPLIDLDFTTVLITQTLAATADVVGTSRTIALVGSGKPTFCVLIEPAGAEFSLAQVLLESITMSLPGDVSGTKIHAIMEKTTTAGDHDKDGVQELNACFRREDMRLLLANTQGRSSVEVLVEGRLITNATFAASLQLTVVVPGGSLSAALAPNPLNPDATLSFLTRVSGPASVDVFDLSGRRVRTLLDAQPLAAGYHEVRVDGRDDRGGPLASGVYFYRISIAGETTAGRFTILK